MKLWTSAKADQVFSKWIRERDKTCYFQCGRPATQNSHFWGRANSATRYDPENCDGVCGKCHFTHEGSKQGEYRDRKLAQLGKNGYESLEKRGRSIMKRKDAIIALMAFLGEI